MPIMKGKIMSAVKLPRVLTFPGTKQNSISVYRALKLAHEVLMEQAQPESEADEDRLNTALDDLSLMMDAVES